MSLQLNNVTARVRQLKRSLGNLPLLAEEWK